MMKRPTPTLAPLDLSRFSNTIGELHSVVEGCERAIEALGRAQRCLKPGPLQNLLALFETDLAVCLDNNACLIADLKGLIESRISESEGKPQ